MHVATSARAQLQRRATRTPNQLRGHSQRACSTTRTLVAPATRAVGLYVPLQLSLMWVLDLARAVLLAGVPVVRIPQG